MRSLVVLCAALTTHDCSANESPNTDAQRPPNVVIIFIDDLGYSDIGPFGAKASHEVFYCYYNGELRAVRDRRWKLFFPHRSNTLGNRPGGRDGTPARYDQIDVGRWLFDLKNDIGETTDDAAEHPDIVARLEQHAEKARLALGDTLTGRNGSEVRPAGQLAGVAQKASGP